jgi:hypothetical protein
VHEDGHVGAVAALVDDGQPGAEALGDGARALDAARVRRDDDRVLEVLLREVVHDDRRGGEEVIHGHVEETLDLPGVEVHREHSMAARGGDEVGHELGGDRHPPHHLAVLAAVAVVGEDRGDAPSGRALERVQHHEELHQVVVHRRAGGLDHEDVLAADVLVDLHVYLAVGKARDVGVAQR